MYLAEEGGLNTRELKLAEEDNGRGSTDSHGDSTMARGSCVAAGSRFPSV